MRVYKLERCRVEVDDDLRRVRTVFDDGNSCDGHPTFDPEQEARARALGYGEDVWRMHWEHELLHSVVAEAAGLDYSPSLRYRITPPAKGVIPMEERIVFLLQRALNDGRAVLPAERAE